MARYSTIEGSATPTGLGRVTLIVTPETLTLSPLDAGSPKRLLTLYIRFPGFGIAADPLVAPTATGTLMIPLTDGTPEQPRYEVA